MWRVKAEDDYGHGEYVYEVDAPRSAEPEQVAISAYSLHGHYYRQGLVKRLLGPEHTVEWVG